MKPIQVIPIILALFFAFSILPSQNVIASEAKQSEKPQVKSGVRSLHLTPNSCGVDSPQLTHNCRGVRPNAPTGNDSEPQTSAVIPVSRTADPESTRTFYYHPWLEHPYQSEMQGPLPPNSGTDDYIILFNAVGPNENSMLGRYLCLAGDQNNDGYDDILAACFDPPEVRLYFGGDPMDTIPDFIFPFEPGVFWAGVMPNELEDLNGDDDVDIVIHWGPDQNYEEVHVFFGGNLLDNEADLILVSDGNSISGDDGFGRYMSCGDLNGDNHKDLVIGAPNYLCSNWMTGKVFCYLGGNNLDSIPDFVITSGNNYFGMGLGAYVSCGGDVNNDGFDDLLCFWNKAYLTDSTGVHLFFGNTILDSIPDWTYKLSYDQYLVINCCIIKDLNNDNYDEIAVVTMFGYGWEIHLFFGGETLGTEPDLIIPGGTEFLKKIKTTGDVNADGYNDLIIGSPDDNWVKIYYGGNPMDILTDIAFYLPDAGYDCGFAGDVNNDGIHDFMFSVLDFYNPTSGEIFIYSDPSLTPHIEPRNNEDYPISFKLEQNFPNPFNSATVIPFKVNKSGKYELNIYNILGQVVYSQEFECSAGENVRILWDGKDKYNNPLPSGIYLVELTNGSERETRMMEILR